MTASTVPVASGSFDAADGPGDTARESGFVRVEEPLLTFDLPQRPACVRLLREADNRALEWHGGPNLRSFYDVQWKRHCSGDSCVLIADFNGFPIGQAVVQWQGKPTHPHIPDVQSLRVFPAFQGMGIGSRLLQVGERVVSSRGFEQISLAVGTENPRARVLYERLGYRAIGEPYEYLWSYSDPRGQTQHVIEIVLDMVKNLREV